MALLIIMGLLLVSLTGVMGTILYVFFILMVFAYIDSIEKRIAKLEERYDTLLKSKHNLIRQEAHEVMMKILVEGKACPLLFSRHYLRYAEDDLIWI